ncbi:MAG: M48 family metallopeptidase [Actinomycetota bacterium]|nr:M48 family metallopeptidase [Actinomycetota bacterium]
MTTQRSSSTPAAPAVSGVQHLPVAPFLTPQPVQAPEVEVRLSTRRRKSAVAYFERGKIVVVVPARLPVTDHQELVDHLIQRLLKRRVEGVASGDRALETRSALLADRYLDGVRPTSVRWVTNQRSRWASCTPATGQIRVSHLLKIVPEWVLDAVLVHELAHLIEPSHSPEFRALENRYTRRRDADVYLAGYLIGLGAAPESWPPPVCGNDDATGANGNLDDDIEAAGDTEPDAPNGPEDRERQVGGDGLGGGRLPGLFV